MKYGYDMNGVVYKMFLDQLSKIAAFFHLKSTDANGAVLSPVTYPLLSVLTVGIIVFLFIVPQFPTVVLTTERLNQQVADNTLLRAKIDTLSTIDIPARRQDLIDMTMLIPDDEDLTSLIGGVTQLAQSQGLSMGNLKLDLQVKPTKAVLFDVEVQGSLSGIQAFLAQVPMVKRIYVPGRLLLRTVTAGSVYVASLQLSAPFQSPPKNLGNAAVLLKEYTDEDKQLLGKIRTFPVYSQVVTATPETAPVPKPNPFQ